MEDKTVKPVFADPGKQNYTRKRKSGNNQYGIEQTVYFNHNTKMRLLLLPSDC